MNIMVNGETVTVGQPGEMSPVTLVDVLRQLQLDPARVAVEHNLEVVPRQMFPSAAVQEGDRLEVVHFIGGGSGGVETEGDETDLLHLAGRTFRSRLLVGTGKYRDFAETAAAIEASGAEIVTVAVRRVNISDPRAPMLTDYVDPRRYTYLPNTAGCYTAEDAVRTLRLAREAGGWNLVKLEVLSDEKYLWPNNQETVRAAEMLIRDGFDVMVYTTDDPHTCRLLESMGCVAIMPLAAPIGSGLGVRNPFTIRMIVEQAKVPVLVDAGVGTASDAAIAMELGCDGVLMNTAIASASDPVRMATAMRLAIQAGRLAYRAGRMPRKAFASASSPLDGTFF
ncbi:sulfur carrier protein ThiS [Candidatus Magnetobacterium casense]|uniref:sulfur carrier protein ThiS n=1 Tax=Candidatus Magnetobacterium casense TaxID=1455061 RepID=UPI00058FB99A|nr:sulfur carrier protein ThiS [Candidatus Magnetobacterium casensis]